MADRDHPSHLDLTVDGRPVRVPDDGSTLLAVLREQLGIVSVKDGCSPQGQCGCCTVLVDGAPRVSCVTPARRVAGRSITTLDGLPDERRRAWSESFCATGASQCGFCTPGIVVRLDALRQRALEPPGHDAVEQSLLAHLCRCTGWRTILDAWDRVGTITDGLAGRDRAAAERRAALEGGVAQRVGPGVAAGEGGFADDTAPRDALVAVPDGRGGWAVAESLADARAAAGKVQGRRSTASAQPPIAAPPGAWDAVLRTSWVEPAYLELDASWAGPDDTVAASPLANGGAFGGKVGSPVSTVARELAQQHGRPVRVLLAREDAVRVGAKRPPVAAGANADGSGVMRVARTAGVGSAIASIAPKMLVEEVDVPGPPTSTALRAVGWAEAAIVLAAARANAGVAARDPVEVTAPSGAWARASVGPDGVRAVVRCGVPLDDVVLRSYCTGAAHMALGWVTSEALAVDADGEVHDLTIRSFGVLRAVDTPRIEIEIQPDDGEPVNGSDAVFAAVAAATWITQGCPPDWPTRVPIRGGGRT
jgi:aerobic-type carbon monoxide dehydrogenase small subunit (CoxS/CutS family)